MHFLIIIFLTVLPIASFGNDSHCYSIQNSDAKNQCLAFVKKQDSYCYSIQESDTKNRCLALVKNQDSSCYSIQNTDMKNHCLALVKNQDSYCYSVRESDSKNLCLAQVKQESLRKFLFPWQSFIASSLSNGTSIRIVLIFYFRSSPAMFRNSV